MTKSEFEGLTGVKVTVDEYRTVEGLYTESPDDKVIFCKKLKAKDFILNLRLERLELLEKKLAAIKETAETQKASGTESYEHAQNRELAQVVKDAFPRDNNNLYGYNRQLMGLERSITAQGILEIIG